MLLFNRPSFKSGLMIVSVVVNNVEHRFGLKPKDKGTIVNFGDDEIKNAVLAKYSAFFTVPV